MLSQPKQQLKYRLARGRRLGAVIATMAMASVLLLGCNSPEEQDLMQPTPDQSPALDGQPSLPSTPPADAPPAATPPAGTPPATGDKDETDPPAPDAGQDDAEDDETQAPGDG